MEAIHLFVVFLIGGLVGYVVSAVLYHRYLDHIMEEKRRLLRIRQSLQALVTQMGMSAERIREADRSDHHVPPKPDRPPIEILHEGFGIVSGQETH